MNGVNLSKATELAGNWAAVWNTGDIEKILDLYADDVRFVSPLAGKFGPTILNSRSELRTYFSAALEANPNLHFVVEEVFPGEAGIAMIVANERGQLICETVFYDEVGKIRECVVFRDEGTNS
ncbi:nuclear transport factor 2 family protein [uncultured Litoreibacter sp.]|uniref:YybH family protein n=1 Tax=uncultured Litoreibacter sp. TaxID=1392394 RepID=UPI00260E87EE|nr:nuclear transport factor 2 family protein [uncultured Litoreibacter sp.]